MIIVRMISGLGNQLFQYGAARRLALKRGAELKFDLSFYDHFKLRQFQLHEFNVVGSIATENEINRVQALHGELGKESKPARFMPEVLDYPDDVYLDGYWSDERYFLDIVDILRKEITLRTPPSNAAKHWAEEIETAACSVSIHIRHGDFVVNRAENYRGVLPLEYYYDCINEIRKDGEPVTAFVFSDNLDWAKKYFRPNAAVEFVEGTRDVEELILMSRCNHNVIANSTFSWWGAWLNPNPNKKVFRPDPPGKIASPLLPPPRDRADNPNSCESWIRMPVDWSLNVPAIEHPPVISIIMTVRNRERDIGLYLQNILQLDFEYCEVILIDDASADNTFEICRQFSARSKKINLLRTTKQIGRSAALNHALEWASSDFIVFADGRNFMLPTALTDFYRVNIEQQADVVHCPNRLIENPNGPIKYHSWRFEASNSPAFSNLNRMSYLDNDLASRLSLIASGGLNLNIGSNMFSRKFLLDNGIKFKEDRANEAEYIFLTRSFLEAEKFLLIPQPAIAVLK